MVASSIACHIVATTPWLFTNCHGVNEIGAPFYGKTTISSGDLYVFFSQKKEN